MSPGTYRPHSWASPDLLRSCQETVPEEEVQRKDDEGPCTSWSWQCQKSEQHSVTDTGESSELRDRKVFFFSSNYGNNFSYLVCLPFIKRRNFELRETLATPNSRQPHCIHKESNIQMYSLSYLVAR